MMLFFFAALALTKLHLACESVLELPLEIMPEDHGNSSEESQQMESEGSVIITIIAVCMVEVCVVLYGQDYVVC